MPFRDFFILLGVLAATALITVVVVETTINQSVGNNQAAEVAPIKTEDSETTASTATPIETTSPIEVGEVGRAEATAPNVPGDITSVRRYSVKLNSASILVRGQSYRGETGRIEVQEVRGAVNSSTIQIPIVRIFSNSSNPLDPIFLLADGPGRTNIWSADIPVWLLNRHDIVMVGYRGVDGSVSLQLPEAQQALFDIRNAPLANDSINTLNQAVGRGLQRLAAAGIRLDHYTAIDVIEDIHEVRDALDYASVNFFAIGYGTQLAMLYGQLYPDFAARNIMFAPPFSLSDTNDVQQLSRHNFGDLVIKLSSLQPRLSQRGNSNQSSELISQVLASFNSGGAISALESINASTIVIVGQQDWTATQAAKNQFMNQLPNGVLVELGDVGRVINDNAYFSSMFRNLTSTFFASGNVVNR